MTARIELGRATVTVEPSNVDVRIIQPGRDGRSAYDVAVANGFVGTEEEWLASLVGGGGAATDHALLTNRGLADQHPMTAITGLTAALAGKLGPSGIVAGSNVSVDAVSVPGSVVISSTGGGGGTSDHTALTNRDANDSHPLSAITGLVSALAGKAAASHTHTLSDLPSTLATTTYVDNAVAAGGGGGGAGATSFSASQPDAGVYGFWAVI